MPRQWEFLVKKQENPKWLYEGSHNGHVVLSLTPLHHNIRTPIWWSADWIQTQIKSLVRLTAATIDDQLANGLSKGVSRESQLLLGFLKSLLQSFFFHFSRACLQLASCAFFGFDQKVKTSLFVSTFILQCHLRRPILFLFNFIGFFFTYT